LVGEVNEKRNSCVAFTLVELLIVVAIIALLASIILPGMSRAREYAYFTRCKSRLRQFCVAFLIHAGDNKGLLPEANTRCTRVSDTTRRRDRRIGTAYPGDIFSGGGSDDSGGGNFFIRAVYGTLEPGQDWNGNVLTGPVRMIGRPREKGRYMPIEIMWDPIVGLRNWGPFGWSDYYTATERQRDYLSRRRGTTIFGYNFFSHSVGCAANQENPGSTAHLLAPLGAATKWTAEAPYRPATRHRNMRMSNKPECWIACCRIPTSKRNRSHFGVSNALQGLLGTFRFNVVHLDGHVDDSTWVDTSTYSTWYIYIGASSRPYGWRCVGGNPDNGVEDNPNIDGSFDENL
jgi:prepilin-type N-terminal cleavage/methylation domain-containing protein